jgi:hypothetical protein
VLSRFQKSCLLAIPLLVPAAFVVRPLCRLDPEVVVAEQLGLLPGENFGAWAAHRIDPWGREWVTHVTRPGVDHLSDVVLSKLDYVYSRGPDGVDDQGAGDDVTLCDADGFKSPGALYALCYFGPGLCAELTALALALVSATSILRAPAGATRKELLRAAFLAAPFLLVVLSSAASLTAYPSVAGLLASAPTVTWLPVPWAVAIGGTLVVCGYLAALYVRMRFAR